MHPTFLAHGQSRPFEDPIFALHHEATRRRVAGEPVIDATLGVLLDEERSLAVLPSLTRALRDVPPEDWAAYAPISGRPDFLQAVAANLFAPERALVEKAVAAATPGGTGAIRVALTTFLRPGDVALTSSFYWPPYATLCEEHGRELSTFEMFDKSGALNVAAFDEALSRILAAQGRALVLVNDPCHNPTGYSMSDADWQGFIGVVERHASKGPITVLLDHAYAGYAPDGRGRAVAHLLRLEGKALPVVAWSASKLFTAYGMRVGALVAVTRDDEERARLRSVMNFTCRGTWSNGNHGAMVACRRLLTETALVESVAKERAVLVGMLGERARAFVAQAQKGGLRHPRYEGGFFVSVDHPKPKVAVERLREKGVFVVPQATSLRVALCAVPTADVPRLTQALVEVQ